VDSELLLNLLDASFKLLHSEDRILTGFQMIVLLGEDCAQVKFVQTLVVVFLGPLVSLVLVLGGPI